MTSNFFQKVKSTLNLETSTVVFNGYRKFKSSDPTESKKRYQEWRQYSNKNGLWPTEFLLPRIQKNITIDLPPLLKEKNHKKYSKDILQKKVKELGYWGYYYELEYGISTQTSERGKNRICYRSKLISETIEDIMGEDFKKCSILDMACNSGFFSLDLANRGAKFVEGIELRTHNFNQAQFMKDYFQEDKVEFFNDDIYEHKFSHNYDIVLMLGLLYHVTKPVELVRKCYDLCTKFTVIDTICHKEPISAYHVMMNKDVEKPGEGNFTVEFHPTYRALIDTMYDAGFKNVIEITGKTDVEIKLYSDNVRRCLIGFK